MGGFGRGGDRSRRSRARPGNIRLVILALLGEAPSNGYALMKSIAERTDNAWQPSPGSMYPTLSQLVDNDLIHDTKSGGQQTFALTTEGATFEAAHTAEIDDAWNEARANTNPDGDEFLASALKLAGATKQFSFSATPEQRKAGRNKMDEARRALYSILAE
ncbi:PadR family transcriptional regulator [Frondihabitans sp. PhB188]|nr:PadR family transcriptional regulator [Frondihabitans sp. PhB188]